MELLRNPVALVLVVVVLGELLGRVRVWGIAIGSTGILVVALAFGHFGHVVGSEFRVLGLVLFIYSVGMQAGPGFAGAFRRHGLTLTLGAVAIVASGTVVAITCALLLELDAGTTAGLLAGALTSTPGLAIAVESVPGPEAPAAYGLTYAVGVLGVVLFVRLVPRMLGVDIAAEEQALAEEQRALHPPVRFHHVEVSNPNVFGKTVGELQVTRVAPVTLTRLLRPGAEHAVLVDAETELAQGDRLRIVGREADLETVGLLLGHPVQECIHFEHGLESRRVVVSRGTTVGMSLEALNLRDAFNVQVSRVIRSGVELAAEDDTELQMGDRVVLVGDGQALRNVARILGNDYAATQFADLPALLLGLLAGLLLGRVPLHLPGVGGFALGTAGGVLVAGLVLGRLHRTGSFQWRLPAATTSFVRDLGLVLFLASVGTVAGATILDTLRTEGLRLLGCGALITFVPLLIGLLVCRRVGRLPVLRTVGVLSGGMTSTPGLAATAGLSTTSHASSAYATVYPAALLSMILAVKVVVLVLGG